MARGPRLHQEARAFFGLVYVSAQGLEFFLQTQFLPLELSQPKIVGGRTGILVLNGPIETFVPQSQLTYAGVYRHGLRLHVVGA